MSWFIYLTVILCVPLGVMRISEKLVPAHDKSRFGIMRNVACAVISGFASATLIVNLDVLLSGPDSFDLIAIIFGTIYLSGISFVILLFRHFNRKS